MRDEWLTVIIVLLIVGIILDGIRRVRAARRERIVMSNNMPESDDFPDDDIGGSEFPSGGARIAGYRHPDDAGGSHGDTTTPKPSRTPTASRAGKLSSTDPEPALGDYDDLDDDVAVAEEVAVATKQRSNVRSKTQVVAEPKTKRPEYLEPQEVIVINVMAAEGRDFPGAHLLQVLTEQNLRWGDMEIFHRHKGEGGSGEILFSLANIVKPGTFDLNTMEQFSSPGVSMFMTLPIRGDSVAGFGLMARTAKAISEALGGELKDENRSVMTQQTFEHCRQRVIEFERKRRLAR